MTYVTCFGIVSILIDSGMRYRYSRWGGRVSLHDHDRPLHQSVVPPSKQISVYHRQSWSCWCPTLPDLFCYQSQTTGAWTSVYSWRSHSIGIGTDCLLAERIPHRQSLELLVESIPECCLVQRIYSRRSISIGVCLRSIRQMACGVSSSNLNDMC